MKQLYGKYSFVTVINYTRYLLLFKILDDKSSSFVTTSHIQ